MRPLMSTGKGRTDREIRGCSPIRLSFALSRPLRRRRHRRRALPFRIRDMVNVVTNMCLLMAASIRRQLFPGSCRTVANIRNLSSPILLCVSRRQHTSILPVVVVSRPSCRASSIHMSHWMPGSLMATNTFGSTAGTVSGTVGPIALCSQHFVPTSQMSSSVATVP